MTTNNNTTFMDVELFQAATKGSINILTRLLDGNSNVLHQITTTKNTVIHIAAKHGHLEFVRYVHSQCPTCLTQANSMRDTPFHVAARAGQAEMVRLLISCTKNSSVPVTDVEHGRAERIGVLKAINNKGESVMHDAVRNSRFEIVKLLIEEDPDLLSLDNYAGESPLYVAVEKGELAIVKEILQAAQYSYLGPNGRTALHAAIFHNRPAIAELLLEAKPEIARSADCNNRSPLHFATTLAFKGLIQLLLKYDNSTICLLDRTGLAPIHIAVLHGRVDIVKQFLRFCPDQKDLSDGQGRNILHLAIEGREVRLVKYILRKKELEDTLNKKDNNGNTPLHLATVSFQPLIVNLLARDKRVDRMEVNNEGLSALAIAVSQNNEKKKSETMLIRVTLFHAARPTWWGKCTSYRAILRQNAREYSMEWYRDKANVLMVVATLIATVSFAAGFTLPGGYQQDKGRDQGMAVLVHRDLFKEFLYHDADCLYTSCVAVAFLMGVQFCDSIFPTGIMFYVAQSFTIRAISSLMTTFYAGVSLTVSLSELEIRDALSFDYYSILVEASVILITWEPIFRFLYLSKHFVYFRSWLAQFELLGDDKPPDSHEKRLRDVLMLQCYKDDGQ